MELLVEGKVVGELEGKIYITHRDSVEHFYRKGLGYPISISVIKELLKREVEDIIIIEHRQDGSRHQYKAKVVDYALMDSFQEEGFDLQKCLPLKNMVYQGPIMIGTSGAL